MWNVVVLLTGVEFLRGVRLLWVHYCGTVYLMAVHAVGIVCRWVLSVEKQ